MPFGFHLSGCRVSHDQRTKVEVIDQAETLTDLSGPGYKTHPLNTNPQRYAMAVNGPWRITFEFDSGHAFRVDLEQYH